MRKQQDHLPEEIVVPESRKTPFYPALDGLRAISVAGVFLVHYMPNQCPFGWLGVQVFFVLSGFLITGILFDTRSDEHRFRNFYVRRALRIFPLYYAVLGILALIAVGTHGHFPQYGWLWGVYLENFWWLLTTSASNDFVTVGPTHPIAAIGHLWSLAVEEQFYLLWPPFVFLLKDRHRLMQTCVVLVVGRLLLGAYWQTHLSPILLGNGITYRMLATQCDGFLIGGWLALWLRGESSRGAGSSSAVLAGIGIALYAGVIALLHFALHWKGVWDYRSTFQATVGIPLINLVAGVVILATIQQRSWIHRTLDHRVLRSLGRVSYGFYVFHLPVLVATRGYTTGLCNKLHVQHGVAVVELVVGAVVTIALAYASFFAYERKFLLLKNKFTTLGNAQEQRAFGHVVH